MSEFKKFLLLAIPFFIFALIWGYQNHKKIERFSIDGVVTGIEWKSRNHGMPKIEIKPRVGTIKLFASNRITLKSNQVKIGSSFEKVKGSKHCTIDRVIIQCVN